MIAGAALWSKPELAVVTIEAIFSFDSSLKANILTTLIAIIISSKYTRFLSRACMNLNVRIERLQLD